MGKVLSRGRLHWRALTVQEERGTVRVHPFLSIFRSSIALIYKWWWPPLQLPQVKESSTWVVENFFPLPGKWWWWSWLISIAGRDSNCKLRETDRWWAAQYFFSRPAGRTVGMLAIPLLYHHHPTCRTSTAWNVLLSLGDTLCYIFCFLSQFAAAVQRKTYLKRLTVTGLQGLNFSFLLSIQLFWLIEKLLTV